MFCLRYDLVRLNGKITIAEKLKPFFDIVVGNGFGLIFFQLQKSHLQETMVLGAGFGFDSQLFIGLLFTQAKHVERLIIVEIIFLQESDTVNRINPLVSEMGVTVFLTNFFNVVMHLRTNVSPQAIDKGLLLGNLDFNDNLCAIVQFD
ncbi:Uncharacterised protein [Streptococcus suis]|uniref:Uncharacterized protein n=1 Tax=Streptococcus suis TaxID=1307 RepID=A0A123U952_STRSU|nr:Uncharacterised protein [Streptococcus suis]